MFVAWGHLPRAFCILVMAFGEAHQIHLAGRDKWSKGCPGLYDWVNPSSLAVEA
jgi:hypothetical protein